MLALGTYGRSAQAPSPVAPPSATDGTEQTTSFPPSEWAKELGALGDLVTRISPPPENVDLLVNNMSSLSADKVAAIDEWLRTNLASRRFRFAEAEAVNTHVKVTLSEGTQGYLIVAQIRHGKDQQVAIFPVGRPETAEKPAGGVRLEDQLIWEQAGKVLDFALPQLGAGASPTLIVLEMGRIAFYVRSQQQWQLNGSVTIPPMRPWLRAPRGYLDLSRGLAETTAMLSGVECKGDFGHPETIQCNFVSQQDAPWTLAEEWKSKNLASAGDAALISLTCHSRSIALATGSGDWMETDFVQGYEVGTLKGQQAMASGEPLELKGPVTALWPAEASGRARAVVENLQSGKYEAHLVTATCSQ